MVPQLMLVLPRQTLTLGRCTDASIVAPKNLPVDPVGSKSPSKIKNHRSMKQLQCTEMAILNGLIRLTMVVWCLVSVC